ncbi:hypothetical protein SS50377_21099 [Spironucleus salmonicida]|uniref:EF-hand domain-containing protein n=2 Tax=Spironucleus TaxID=39709 RepID=V6LJJ0_9EUKA|nr:hypothetical protein SS50377_21099 [Spironucleus salmonicida]|eukprot:EST43881.1 hypothetical protein SS50377_16181 [Spironucleus salmonicida]
MSIQQAADYLKKYSVQSLYDYIMSQIVFYRPEDPRTFISDLLNQISEGTLKFFEIDEIKLVFKKFEVLERGHLSSDQATKALQDLGFDSQFEGNVDLNQFLAEFDSQSTKKLNLWLGK